MARMLFCMRTTLNLDDKLLRGVKQRAATTGQTMTQLIERALRDALAPVQRRATAHRFKWKTVAGRRPPAGLDLADRDALYERMEDRG